MPLTSEEMQNKDKFINWDFDNTWIINNSHPMLKWQVEGTLPDSYVISDVSLTENKVVAKVTKTFTKEQQDNIVYAAYDGQGKMIAMICDTISMDIGTNSFASSKSFEFSENNNPAIIKVFIWSNINDMTPISNVKNISL
jgi:hypothetical protein